MVNPYGNVYAVSNDSCFGVRMSTDSRVSLGTTLQMSVAKQDLFLTGSQMTFSLAVLGPILARLSGYYLKIFGRCLTIVGRGFSFIAQIIKVQFPSRCEETLLLNGSMLNGSRLYMTMTGVITVTSFDLGGAVQSRSKSSRNSVSSPGEDLTRGEIFVSRLAP